MKKVKEESGFLAATSYVNAMEELSGFYGANLICSVKLLEEFGNVLADEELKEEINGNN